MPEANEVAALQILMKCWRCILATNKGDGLSKHQHIAVYLMIELFTTKLKVLV
jgi:hypothetical protein